MFFHIGLSTTNGREFKGKSLLELPENYIVLDLETTGLMPMFDDIIEIGAIRYQNDVELDRFHSLVSVGYPLDPFIVSHTGITDAMLEGAPKISEVLPLFLDFVGGDTIVAHNANFDINFIYDNALNILDRKFSNDFVDTMRIARRCALPVENHKLVTLAEYFNINQKVAHRSTADCETTYALFVELKKYICQNNISLLPKHSQSRPISEITATTTDIDPDSPFYQKVVVFTGGLDSMVRKDAAQIVANLGGILGDGVTQKTNYLILGNTAYRSNVKDGKSSKYKKAEQLILKGQDLQIIPESVFLSMISDK